MASGWFNQAKKDVMDGTVNLSTDTIKVMLVTNAYTFNPDDDFISSGAGTPGGSELSGTGYTSGFGNSGRKTLANKTVTADDTNNIGKFDADDVTWTAINAGTAQAAILVKEVTNDAASRLIAYVDFTTGKVTNGSDLTISWNSGGILTIS